MFTKLFQIISFLSLTELLFFILLFIHSCYFCGAFKDSQIFCLLHSAALELPESPSYIICIQSTLIYFTTTVSPIV